jgi:predicted DNA-binding antitoxin AbrB/MazE fold protein
MDETITAIYENGVLRPLAPLALPEHTTVQISIKTVPPPAGAVARRSMIIQTLVAAGLAAPPPSASPSSLLSEQERHELAHRIPAGRPLSEIIIEEREER